MLEHVVYVSTPPAGHDELIPVGEFATSMSDGLFGAPNLRIRRLPIELNEQQTDDHAGDR
jgi:hypothetical protein